MRNSFGQNWQVQGVFRKWQELYVDEVAVTVLGTRQRDYLWVNRLKYSLGTYRVNLFSIFSMA